MAIARGAQGVVVSNYGGLAHRGEPPLSSACPPSSTRVAGKVPVFIDGSFRRGTDIVKALALGATAVLVGRPVMWGLAAYGSDGVQGVVEMLQTELARYMAMSRQPDLEALDRTLLQDSQRESSEGTRGTNRNGLAAGSHSPACVDQPRRAWRPGPRSFVVAAAQLDPRPLRNTCDSLAWTRW